MACDPAAVHVALADQIREGISRDWNVCAWPNSGMTPPLVEIWPGDPYIDYWWTFGANGLSGMNLRIRVLGAAGNPETAFRQITDFLAAGTGYGSSLVDVIHADTTLGGEVRTCIVRPVEWDAGGDFPLNPEAWVPVEIVLAKSGAEA